MNLTLQHAALLLIGAFALSIGLTRLMIRLGPKLGLMDQPDARRVHLTPIPRAGGLAVWLTFLTAYYLGAALWPDLFAGAPRGYMTAFTAASTLLMAVGLIDDRQGMKPLAKLAGHIAASALFFWMSPVNQGNILGYPLPFIVDMGIFVIWSVLLINAFNLIDGLDGLCGGLVTISLCVLTALALVNQNPAMAMISATMLVSLAGFMKFNLNPARIFLGDAGSMLLGFFIACATSQSGGRRAVIGSLLLPIAIAGIPLLDVMLAIWRRSVRNVVSQWSGGDKVGVFSPDKDHLHHRFLARGMHQKHVAMLIQAIAILIAAFCMAPMLLGTRGLSITVCGLMLLGLFGLRHLAQVELLQTGSLIHLVVKRRHNPGAMRVWYYLYDILALSLAAIIAMAIETNLGTRPYDLLSSVRFLATFLTCEVVAIQILRIYRRVWNRSALREFLTIAVGLTVGGAVASSLFWATQADIAWSDFRCSFIAVQLAIWFLLVPRALPEIFRELAVDSGHRNLTKRENAGKQVLVYGAGDLGNLFVDYLKTCTPAQFQNFQISGFLDENPKLKNRTIKGFKIHGDLDVLEALNSEFPVHGILIAIDGISEEQLEGVMTLAARLGIAVYRWDADFKPSRIMSGLATMPVILPGELPGRAVLDFKNPENA